MQTLNLAVSQPIQPPAVEATPRQMMNERTETCPHCGSDLRAMKIPDAARRFYLPLEMIDGDIPDDGRELYYSRLIGLSSPLFDRVLAFKCPDCDNVDVVPGKERMWELQRQSDANREAMATVPNALKDSAQKLLPHVSCESHGGCSLD